MHIVTLMHPSLQECTWINLHAISRVNLPGAFLTGGTPFGLNTLQAPARVGKKNNRQQKNPKKKKSTSRMKAISNYVPALRIMQQDKTAANPNPPKTNQHKENCYKLDGYKLNHYRKHCSRIIQSVRKFLLTTNADNCFKLLSKFPDCTLQVLTLFVAQYPPRCYCIVRCIDFVQFRVQQRVHYKLVMKTYEVSCCFM